MEREGSGGWWGWMMGVDGGRRRGEAPNPVNTRADGQLTYNLLQPWTVVVWTIIVRKVVLVARRLMV